MKATLRALTGSVLALLGMAPAAYTETINDVSISSGIHVIDSVANRPGANYTRDTISVDSTVT